METNTTLTVADERFREELKNFLTTFYDNQVFQIGKMFGVFKRYMESKGIDTPDLPYNTFYSVRQELSNKGILKCIKHGYYFVSSEGAEDYYETDTEEDDVTDDQDIDICTDSESETRYMGEGSGEIYLYYYPAYAELAKLQGKSTFRCKIGKTGYDHKKRLSAASKTDAPEIKVVPLVFKTDSPDELELLIHSALKLSGKQLEDTPGREWFDTNIDEVIQIYDSIMKVCFGARPA